MNNENDVYIDIDAAIDGYNSNPKNEKVSRPQFCRILGISYQTAYNMQRGVQQKQINNLQKLIRLSGLKYEDLVKPLKK